MSGPVTLMRLAVLANTGFDSASSLAEAVLDHVASVGKEALGRSDLSKEQTSGIRGTLNDTPLAMRYIINLIRGLPIAEEQKENCAFMLARMIEDMLDLGASAVIDKKAIIRSSLLEMGGRVGGVSSGRTRNKIANETWRPHAEALAKKKRLEQPSLTQRDLANVVLESWQLKIDKPGFDSLLIYIRSLEKNTVIPKRAIPLTTATIQERTSANKV